MVTILLLIGQHAEEPNIVQKLLNVDEMPSKPIYAYAPPENLVLHACAFSPLDIPAWLLPRDAGEHVERHWSGAANLYRVKSVTARRMCLSSYDDAENASAVKTILYEKQLANEESGAIQSSKKKKKKKKKKKNAEKKEEEEEEEEEEKEKEEEEKEEEEERTSEAAESEWVCGTLAEFEKREHVKLVPPSVRGSSNAKTAAVVAAAAATAASHAARERSGGADTNKRRKVDSSGQDVDNGARTRTRHVVRTNSVIEAMTRDIHTHQPLLARPIEATIEERVAIFEKRKEKKEKARAEEMKE